MYSRMIWAGDVVDGIFLCSRMLTEGKNLVGC